MKKPKILLIEDENFLIKPLEFAFKKAGIGLAVAKDGETGLVMLEQYQPDLVLLDLLLPKMSGFDVLAKIKSDRAMKKIPVLILSNLAREEEVRRGLAGGAIGYIVKTNLSIASLLEKVREIVSE